MLVLRIRESQHSPRFAFVPLLYPETDIPLVFIMKWVLLCFVPLLQSKRVVFDGAEPPS